MTESRLCPLPGASLMISPPDLRMQVHSCWEVQLDLARLPQDALQGLHTGIFQEIQHRDPQIHQWLGLAEQTITESNAAIALATTQQKELESFIHQLCAEVPVEITATTTPQQRLKGWSPH